MTTKTNIYEFGDYKVYVNSWISERPNFGRGEKSKMAECARCHLAYISQVLKGSSHFSLEQAEALNSLFEHGEEESHFFILLVEKGRAGTKTLKDYFEKQIQKVLSQRQQLKNRFQDKKMLTQDMQTTYYSHWAYCAIHMVVLTPELRTTSTISKHFDLSISKTIAILDFLTNAGLVVEKSGFYFPGEVRIHLAHDSPMISKHHTNWRMQAIRSLEKETPSELHYSGVISLSKNDLPKVREALVKAIENIRAIVKGSEDETVYCYAVDFFGLGKN